MPKIITEQGDEIVFEGTITIASGFSSVFVGDNNDFTLSEIVDIFNLAEGENTEELDAVRVTLTATLSFDTPADPINDALNFGATEANSLDEALSFQSADPLAGLSFDAPAEAVDPLNNALNSL